MKKYVYLFELDSVRKTDEEIIVGQKALYNEIVHNGNIVVLTYNQLIDSRAFFSLLDNREYYENFIGLFGKGLIRISQFGSIRTIAQYLLDTIETEDNKYIYSALPIKGCQRRLVELIKRSITYSDLSEIDEYIHRKNRTDDDLKDLFVEVELKKDSNNKEYLAEKESDLTVSEMNNVLENLYWLLGMVHRLSTIHDAFVVPRDPREYEHHRLHDYLRYVSHMKRSEEIDPLWNKAIDILMELDCWGKDKRSLYFHELRNLSKENAPSDKKFFQYAEAIVSLCTNYTYEMSICNISKHYNAADIEQDYSDQSSYTVDFLKRLALYWNSGIDADKKFLRDEDNEFVEFENMDAIPDFSRAVRVISPVDSEEHGVTVHRYEHKLKTQQRRQKFAFIKKASGRILSLIFVVLLVMLLNIVLELIHDLYSGEYTALNSWKTVIDSIIFLGIGEFVTTLISKRFPGFLSLSEAVQGIGRAIQDAWHLLFTRVNTYASEYDVDKTENQSETAPIDFCMTKELKAYTAFYSNNGDLTAFAPEYPIANVKDKDIQKRILRNQELFRQKYGIMYRSPYNTLVVDPIEGGRNEFFAYERIVPTADKNGVVLFVMCNGKIVLLSQFRHAIRREQLCCPRGFGENDIAPIDNAKKELYEELGAVVIEDPVELGHIVADSGLSSGIATVYLMKIDGYNNVQNEGIRCISEVTPDELGERIKTGEIDDGYTLAAYSLYTAYMRSLA